MVQCYHDDARFIDRLKKLLADSINEWRKHFSTTAAAQPSTSTSSPSSTATQEIDDEGEVDGSDSVVKVEKRVKRVVVCISSDSE